jgi:hypothetical protein
MSPVLPLLRIPVGIVVERCKASSRWADVPEAAGRGPPEASV